jgi:malonyl-CoA O-methyltransferase
MSNEPRHVLRHFDRIAGQYDRHAAVQTEVATRLIERLDGLNFQPRRILDLGCGTAQPTLALGKRFPDAGIIALDGARGMLAQARRQRGRWRRRFELVAATAEALPLADSSFDLVYSSMVLEWCRDPEQVLREARRVLRPGGLLLLATTGPDTHRELHRALAGQIELLAGSGVIHAMRLGDLLVRGGFREPVIDSDWLTSSHSGLDDMLADLHRTGTALSSDIDAGELSAHYPDPTDDHERYSLTWEIVYASAWAPEHGQPMRSEHGEIASIPASGIPVRRRG